jgi:hypothetical protein
MLEKFNSCTTWLEGFRSEKTKKNYTLHLSLFAKFHNTNPDALIAINPSAIREMILKYIIHLKKVAKNTASKPIEGEICVNSSSLYDRHPIIF